MPARHIDEPSLAPELETIAQIADRQLRTEVQLLGSDRENLERIDTRVELQEALVQAASAALIAGIPLSSVADAEQTGRARARRELGSELLRRVERAARRHRETQTEHEQTIAGADRLGLSHREISTAAQVAPGTVRAIAARSCTSRVCAEENASSNGAAPHADTAEEHHDG